MVLIFYSSDCHHWDATPGPIVFVGGSQSTGWGNSKSGIFLDDPETAQHQGQSIFGSYLLTY